MYSSYFLHNFNLKWVYRLFQHIPRFISGAGIPYPSGAPEFTPGFQWGSCYSIFSFICMFCRSLFVLLYFFLWSFCCLFFFDIRILIAPLVSSHFSYPIIQRQEEFEVTKGVIRIRISKKNRQHNDQKKKYRRTNNDLQNIHIKLKIE